MSDKRAAYALLLCGVALALILTVQQFSAEYRELSQPEYFIARRWGYAAVGLLVTSGALLMWVTRGRGR